ncbi:MAG: hypothetical protein CFE23_05525 [Flavobacterium sp. BFFFF1]|uniref:hypothetical protein n=1 Tax=Flavobacterium sp. BFFFF1 TaxID=2015557 RepID=UPI000BCF9D69|nr:hypothetical protein [Flavobacterium sp. BFFFF1]OYU81225.1 MAG: hypothetical protein CFE23_05525 [Flavobacterium sp. BFFFF1]
MSQFVFYLNTIIGFSLLIIYFKRKKTKQFEASLIVPFLYLELFSNLYELIATDIFSVHSAVYFKVYIFLEFYVLLNLFYKLSGKTMKWLYISFGVLFLLFFIFACLGFEWSFSQSLKTDSYLSAFELIVIYVLAIHWFTRLFKYLPDISLLDMPNFYFVSGLIIYLSGPIFLFLVSSQILSSDPEKFGEYWIINNIFNIILKLFLIKGIWKIKK